MTNLAHKLLNRSLRKARVRSVVHGTAERPRLSVTISNMHVSAQLVDDVKGHTMASATTVGQKVTGTKSEKCQAIAPRSRRQTNRTSEARTSYSRRWQPVAARNQAIVIAYQNDLRDLMY